MRWSRYPLWNWRKKSMAAEAGVPYQSLINLYLRDCLAQHSKVEIKWPSAA